MSDTVIGDVHRRQIRTAFARAARDYERFAVLQQEVAKRLLERLSYIKMSPQMILDVGAGTGFSTRSLSNLYRRARLTAVDPAFEMLQQLKQNSTWRNRSRIHTVAAYAEALPFENNVFDMVYSNLTLQWCGEPDLAFSEMIRVLKPNGLLIFTSLGPDTLTELRQSWETVDDYQHVNKFIDMHDVGDSLVRSGFENSVMDAEKIIMTYTDVIKLMRELKQIGANTIVGTRRPTLLGKNNLQKLKNAYEKYRSDGKLPLTFEVIYGHGWKPQFQDRTQVKIPIASIKRL